MMAILQWVIRRAGTLAVLGAALSLPGGVASADVPCVADCDASNSVEINELVTCVNSALGNTGVDTCEACDADRNGVVTINELIAAVNNALNGCRCPLQPGMYTFTAVEGGTLRVATLSTINFPAFGTIVADVSAGDAHCVHRAVVPFPNPLGFTAPAFCIPGVGFTVTVQQTACGIGRIDSDGGSDYGFTELGDTSDSSPTCDLPQTSCAAGSPAPDSSIRVTVTTGNDTPDVCAGGGTANMIVAIPVLTTTWVEHSSGSSCPANDGTFDPDRGDTFISRFPQILDFTTDTSSAKFQDLDGDGCFKSGAGPERGFAAAGTCIDLSKLNALARKCHTSSAPCTADADCGVNGPCEDFMQCKQLAAATCTSATDFHCAACTTDADCVDADTGQDRGPCIRVGAAGATIVASGTIGSSGAPLYDIAFATTLVNAVSGPEAPLGATCDSPPLIDFNGTFDRCIHVP